MGYVKVFHSCQSTTEPERNEPSLRFFFFFLKGKILKDAEENFALILRLSAVELRPGQSFLLYPCYYDSSSFIHSFIH